MSKKETTIDDLAGMVQKGFVGIDKRFDDMATKDDLTQVNTHLGSIDTRLDHIENMLLRATRIAWKSWKTRCA
jgi:hypothetical protein